MAAFCAICVEGDDSLPLCCKISKAECTLYMKHNPQTLQGASVSHSKIQITCCINPSEEGIVIPLQNIPF
jgi:hypothetical protein